MLSKQINISELFNSTSIVTRRAARDLSEIISKLPENNINLDFSTIAHASRSFFDELNSHQNKLKLKGKNINLINLSANLKDLLQIVRNASQLKRPSVFTPMTNIKIITI